MSGPKGYNVELERRLRIQRETDAAKARCEDLAARITTCQQQATALDGQRRQSPHVTTGDLAHHELQERALRSQLDTVESQLTAARQRAAAAELRSSWGESRDLAIGIPTGTKAGDDSGKTENSDRRLALLTSLERCVDLMSGLDHPARDPFLTQALKLRDGAASLGLGALDAAVLTLQSGIEDALDTQRDRTQARRTAADIIGDLCDLDSADPELVALTSLAATVMTTQEVAVLRQRALTLRARIEKERDAALILEHTKEALCDLGYEIGEDLTVAASTGETFVATRADLPQHGLRVQVLPTGKVLTRVVAFGETDPLRDQEVETSTCHDLDALQTRWAEAGIGAVRYLRQPIGTIPVSRVERPRRVTRRAQARRQQG